MRKGIAAIVAVLLSFPLMTATAQMSGTASGRYATMNISDDVTPMPDGSSVVLSHYHQIAFAESGKHPIDNMSTSCIGQFKLNADGRPTAASGSCFATDADGDGASFWWRMTEAYTANCADLCGVWGYYAGNGKLSGIEGTGTWQRTTVFSDGSSGRWQASYKLP